MPSLSATRIETRRAPLASRASAIFGARTGLRRRRRDRRRRRLLLARDRLGIKPLYLAELPNGGLAFGSEIKALLALPEVPRRLSAEALGLYLDVMYTPGRDTMFAGIRRLPPGHLLVA